MSDSAVLQCIVLYYFSIGGIAPSPLRPAGASPCTHFTGRGLLPLTSERDVKWIPRLILFIAKHIGTRILGTECRLVFFQTKTKPNTMRKPFRTMSDPAGRGGPRGRRVHGTLPLVAPLCTGIERMTPRLLLCITKHTGSRILGTEM